MTKQEKKGIWKYADFYPFVPENARLTLGEGATRLIEKDGIYFKCEFDNPTGSVKDRGIAYQISDLLARNISAAVISSSGNAAISAVKYAKLAGIECSIFVSPKIDQEKRKILEKEKAKLFITNTPLKDSFQFSQNENVHNLRPSASPIGFVGYTSISFELIAELKNVDSVFFPVSSGTTLFGVAKGFEILGIMPKLYAVQTERIHTVAGIFDRDFSEKDFSIADAIVARSIPQKKEVLESIRKSAGGGFVVSDNEIRRSYDYLKNHDLDSSFEGALALAGIWKGKEKGFLLGKTVCLLTGKKYEAH